MAKHPLDGPMPATCKPRASPLASAAYAMTVPCRLLRFAHDLHKEFGGFVTVGILQYGVQQGAGDITMRLAMRYFLKDVSGDRGSVVTGSCRECVRAFLRALRSRWAMAGAQ